MDVKRAVAMVVAFCLGVAIGAAAFYGLRPTPRTGVDPIEIERQRDDGPGGDQQNTPPKKNRPGPDKKDDGRGNRGPADGQRKESGDGAAPAPRPPAPAGDDDGGGDDSDDDGGDDDGGGDD